MTTADLSRHAQIAHDLLHGRSSASQPAVSPDGEHVVGVVATIDVDDNTTRSIVWLDGAPVTDGPHDGAPAWSPTGRWLAFTARRGERKGDSTLHVLPVDGPGETRTVCTMPDGLDGVAWSPDGRWLAFLSRSRHERYEAKDVSWQSPRKIERYFSRLNGEDWVFDRPRHVYVVPADGTARPRNLTPGPTQFDDLAWLADSTGLVVSAARHDTWDLDLAVDLHRLSLDGEITTLTEQTGAYHHGSPSPDGGWIAFLGHDDARTYPQNSKVGIMRPDGSERRWISEGLDRTFAPSTCLRRPLWLDENTLLAAAEDRGEQHVYRLDTDGSVPAPVTSGAINVVGFDAAGGTLATVVTSVDRPAEIVVRRDGDTASSTTVSTAVSGGYLRWERFTAPCTDGSDEIDAWIMRPADFDASQRYPVLLNVHGGPFGQYGENFFDEAQMQARAGFVVLMSNPRGGSGRHTEWGQSIMGPGHGGGKGTGWGTVDVDDVIAVLEHAIERYSFCDADRVGMLGGSYGGYMATMLAARHGDRFRAVSSERSVNNLLTEEWSSDIGSMFQVELGPDPVEDPDEYLRMSPIRLARHPRPDADHPLRGGLALPRQPGRGALDDIADAGSRGDVLPVPGREPRAVPKRFAAASSDARRDHPRLLRRALGRAGAGVVTVRRLTIAAAALFTTAIAPSAAVASPDRALARLGTATVEIASQDDAALASAAAVVATTGGRIIGSAPGVLLADVSPLDWPQVAAVENVELRAPVPVDVRPDLVLESVPEQFGPTTGAAEQVTLADAWHAAGIDGTGVRVGVVDFFDMLYWDVDEHGPLPQPGVNARCFDQGRDCTGEFFDSDDLGGEDHGVAVVEIIRDMAPGAQIYIGQAGTLSDYEALVDWFVANDVQIISRSLGSRYDGPGDGRGALDEIVARAVSRGITWINSGGNNGDGQYYRHQVRLAGDRVAFGPSGDNTFLEAPGLRRPGWDALGERLGSRGRRPDRLRPVRVGLARRLTR